MSQRIRPWIENPRYWQYKGRPVLLLGGTREDNLFQIPDLREHLDLLVSVGGNYIRNTMSDRDPGDAYPYRQTGDGKYDLDQWNDEYWRRFHTMLELTAERDIIVQIEVWDRFDLTDVRGEGFWQRHPHRPANNVNYTGEDVGLDDAYPDHPSADKHPFYHSIPGMKAYRPLYDRLRAYQERYVEKLLSHTLPFGNVLYCMNNETSTEPAWGQYWMQFIKDRAAKAGVDVCVTDMFDDAWRPETSASLRQVIDQPQRYDFVEVSQVNSRNMGEDHWDRMMWIVEQVQPHPRPINHTKIYSAGQTSFGSGTQQDGIERFWRNLLAGSASSRFHRPPSGIGLSPTTQACLRAARKVETVVPFWTLRPHMPLLVKRQPNAAYLAARPGEAYVVFFCRGGSVELNLADAASPLRLRWIDISTGEWGGEAEIDACSAVALAAPGEAPWVALITRG